MNQPAPGPEPSPARCPRPRRRTPGRGRVPRPWDCGPVGDIIGGDWPTRPPTPSSGSSPTSGARPRDRRSSPRGARLRDRRRGVRDRRAGAADRGRHPRRRRAPPDLGSTPGLRGVVQRRRDRAPPHGPPSRRRRPLTAAQPTVQTVQSWGPPCLHLPPARRHHHRLRPRRAHRRRLHRPGQPPAAGARGRAVLDQRPARRPADAHHRGRELPRLPRGIMGPELMIALPGAGRPLRRRDPDREGHAGSTCRRRPFGVWVGDPDAAEPTYRAQAVIVSTGAQSLMLGLPSEAGCSATASRPAPPATASSSGTTTSPWSAAATRPSRRPSSSPSSPTRSPSSTAATSCGRRRSCRTGPSPTPRSAFLLEHAWSTRSSATRKVEGVRRRERR